MADKIQQYKPIQLLELKAKGKFGRCIWRARLKTDEIAVKVFHSRDKESFLTEQKIFNVSLR